MDLLTLFNERLQNYKFKISGKTDELKLELFCKDLIIMVLLSKGYIMQNFDRGIDADTMNSIFAAAPSPNPEQSPPAFHQPFKNVLDICSIPLIGTRKYLQHLLKNNFNSKNT